jgi:hypothetical protein
MTLIVDPSAQLWVFRDFHWHIAYNTGRETVGVLVAIIKTKIKWSTAQNISLTMFFIVLPQLLELPIPLFLGLENETYFVEHIFSFRV